MWRLWERLLAPARVTDEDYVERIRRGLAFWKRFRRVLLVTNTLLIAAFVVGMLFAADALQLFIRGNQGQGVPFGFVIGVLLGLLVACALDHVTRGLVNAQRSWRTELLLLRYHDALAVLAKERRNAGAANA